MSNHFPLFHIPSALSPSGLFAWLCKPKFWLTRPYLCSHPRVLDMGVANNSYRESIAVLSPALYHGLDLESSEIPVREVDRFFQVNLSCDDLNIVGDCKYDLIIANHIFEHLHDPYVIFRQACDHLASGGIHYVEFPSIKTAYGAKKFGAQYHFHDDPSHIRILSLHRLCNIALDSGCQILSAGPVSTPLKNLFSLFRFVFSGFKTSFLSHSLGYIDHVMIRKF